MFNNKNVKKFRFRVNAEDETEAFEQADDIIRAKIKHKIVKIDNEDVIEDIDSFDNKTEKILDPDDEFEKTTKQFNELYSDLTKLNDMFKMLKNMKDRNL